MLIKKIFLYIFKKLIKFCFLFLLFCLITKCYYYIFLGYYFLNEELFYNINIYFFYLFLFLVTLYFRFLLSFFFIIENVTMFYGLIYFYSTCCEIKQLGLLNFFNKKKKLFFNNLIYKVKKYWEFRRKLSPLNKKINIILYSSLKKYYAEIDKLKKQKIEEKIKKFRQKRNNPHKMNLHQYNEFLKDKKIDGISTKQKFYKINEKNEYAHLKPKPMRLIKKKDFFSRYIRWIDNKKNNVFLKIVLNIVMTFFFFTDIIYFYLLFLLKSNKNIRWKPLNIRLPYFKKIKK